MKIFGDVKNLNAKERSILEDLSSMRSFGDVVCDSALAVSASEIVQKINLPIGLLLHRDGRIDHVILGTKHRMYLPDLGRVRLDELKLRRLRLVVFWPSAHHKWVNKLGIEATTFSDTKNLYPLIQTDFYTDLEKLRLDCLLFVSVESGDLKSCTFSYVNPQYINSSNHNQKFTKEYYNKISDLNLQYQSFIQNIEKVRKEYTHRLKSTKNDLAVIVGAYEASNKDHMYSLIELRELCYSAGIEIADEFIQRRRVLDPRTVLGKGKIEDLMLRALDIGADLLIFDTELTPSQLREITKITQHRVLDRSMLILDIFAQRAKSSEGKLQVELAQLKYNLPRLTDKDSGLSRLTGGVGGRGPGETKLEISRRRARDRIVFLEKKINVLSDQRKLRRSRRYEKRVPIIGIVGYTNAGKSSLLNALSKSNTIAEDKLFATLDPSSRRMRFPSDKEVIFVDTVGFIRNLPKELIGAFRATLEELLDADILLHVLDASSSDFAKHFSVVEKTLEDIGCGDKKKILVLNKVDLLSEPEISSIEASYNGISVSVLERRNLNVIIDQIVELLNDSKEKSDPSNFLEYPAGG